MKELVAWIFGFGLILNSVIFVPQALTIWRKKRADGVSIVTFFSFNALQLIGALHGYFQHDRPLMIGMLASLLTCGAVTVLAVTYRHGPPTMS